MDLQPACQLSTVAAQRTYDPASVLPDRNKFLNHRVRFRDNNNREYVRVQLTAAGNEALCTLCHTPIQRQVWSWPCYEFTIRVINGEPCVKVAKIKMAHPSYVNALLIASRGIPMPNSCEYSTNGCPFGGNVRLPGTFNGACANCQWRELLSS